MHLPTNKLLRPLSVKQEKFDIELKLKVQNPFFELFTVWKALSLFFLLMGLRTLTENCIKFQQWEGNEIFTVAM